LFVEAGVRTEEMWIYRVFFFAWPIRAGPTFCQRCLVHHVSGSSAVDDDS